MAVRKWCKTEENRDINVHVARLLVDLDVFVENVEWQVIIEAKRVRDNVIERERWYSMKDNGVVLIHTEWYGNLPTSWCLEFSMLEGKKWLRGSISDYVYYAKIGVYRDVSFKVVGNVPSDVLQLIPTL
jgi:hypothetical protein